MTITITAKLTGHTLTVERIVDVPELEGTRLHRQAKTNTFSGPVYVFIERRAGVFVADHGTNRNRGDLNPCNDHWTNGRLLAETMAGLAGPYENLRYAAIAAAPAVASTVVETVPARNGMLGYRVHALRVGVPLPGGQHIADVTDYGSDTHLSVTDTAGCEQYVSRHAEIRELETGVIQLITPEHAAWASD